MYMLVCLSLFNGVCVCVRTAHMCVRLKILRANSHPNRNRLEASIQQKWYLENGLYIYVCVYV